MPDPGRGNLVVVVPELHLQQRVPDHLVRLLPDALDQPRLGGGLVQTAPLRWVAGGGGVQPAPDAPPPRPRREPEQIEGRAERVVPAVVVEGGMRLPPVELRT